MFTYSGFDSCLAILKDVRLPKMDELEATAAVRAQDRSDATGIPIIPPVANAFDIDVQLVRTPVAEEMRAFWTSDMGGRE